MLFAGLFSFSPVFTHRKYVGGSLNLFFAVLPVYLIMELVLMQGTYAANDRRMARNFWVTPTKCF